MAKRDKYHPDYRKLYPNTVFTAEVTKVLMHSDRKMKYMEVEIKSGEFLQDSADFIPTREDSLDRLMDDNKLDFPSAEKTPEEIVILRDEFDRLSKALKNLKSEEYALIHAVFFDGIKENVLAKQEGITQQGISWRLQSILSKLKILMED